MKMSVKRMAIAGIAVSALASVGGAAFAKTPTARPTGTVAHITSEVGSEQVTETGGGSTAESDGPGGHEDPAGNVDHQFEGQE
jgi:hypothetical protein